MKNIKTILTGIVSGFINGFFGSGGGIILVVFLRRILKLETKHAHATSIAIILPISILSGILYLNKVDIDFKILMFISIGGIVGGFLGSKYLKKINNKILKKIFAAIILVAGIKMLL